MLTLSYGADPEQKAELYHPSSRSHGVVVMIHGGFWRAKYGLGIARPLAESLVRQGWTVLNLEYRRGGNGGGIPETLDDVSAGIDLLADLDDVDTSKVVTIGHSAGGHLAVWAAGRDRLERWANPRVPVTAAISQAGVVDVRTAIDLHLGAGAVADFIGLENLAVADPIAQAPLEVPVWCVHGVDDVQVPLAQSEAYVERARAGGGRAGLAAVEGDHFSHLDVTSVAWTRTLEILDDL